VKPRKKVLNPPVRLALRRIGTGYVHDTCKPLPKWLSIGRLRELYRRGAIFVVGRPGPNLIEYRAVNVRKK
jgi:hypothetical protein